MPHRHPPALRRQVIELARSGTKVAQLAATFGISDATIYNWLNGHKRPPGQVRRPTLGTQITPPERGFARSG
jgi:transposase-like protein